MSRKMTRTAAFEHFPCDVLREIMLYTYVHVLEPLYEEAEFDLQVLSPPISASHVCRSWRRHLLSDPTMWSCLLIPQMKPDGIKELLRRSDSSLLNIFLELNGTQGLDHANTIEMLSSLFQQTHRFKTLRLKIAPLTDLYEPSLESLVQLVLSHLKRPAPNLETFSFWYNSLSGLSSDLNPDHEYPVTLFSGDAPNLKRIHHRLSIDFQESTYPPFHNLSELHLTLLFDIKFDLFLDLIAASPGLKILHVYVDWSSIDVEAVLESSSDQMVNLPCLEKLVLEVNHAVELVSLVLKHITLPSNLKWYIASLQYPDFKQSPYLLRFLSRAHFTSLHVRFAEPMTMLLQENQDTSNQSDENGLMCIYEDPVHLVIIGIPFIRTLKSSCITHVELEFQNSSEDNVMFTYAIDMMSHLESLTARRMIVIDADEWFVQWFIALVPNAPKVMTYVTGTFEAQDPDFNLTSIDLEEIISASDLDPASGPTQATAFSIPCPLLRKLTLEVKHTLRKIHVFNLIVCSVIRRKKGYPLQISIQCPQMEEGVEDRLKLSKNGDVQVLIDLDR